MEFQENPAQQGTDHQHGSCDLLFSSYAIVLQLCLFLPLLQATQKTGIASFSFAQQQNPELSVNSKDCDKVQMAGEFAVSSY